MPLVIPKKPKKFDHCQMISDPRIDPEDRKKCKRQCSFCMMIQYSKENPGKKPYILK